MTNRHVVVDSKNRCARDVNVTSFLGENIHVTEWLIPQDKEIDISIGLMNGTSKYPVLNITSKHGIKENMLLQAVSIRNTILVALSGRVVVTDPVKMFPIITDGGGARGFSGTGYVDYLGRLSVIHVGKAPETEVIGSTEEDTDEASEDIAERLEEAGFSEMAAAKTLCRSLLRAGDGEFIDACIELGDLSRCLADESRSKLDRRCREGWRNFNTGNLVKPLKQVEDCADLFGGRISATGHCRAGWKAAVRTTPTPPSSSTALTS